MIALPLGMTPKKEHAPKYNSPDYTVRAVRCCTELVAQLIRAHGHPPRLARLGLFTTWDPAFRVWRVEVHLIYEPRYGSAVDYAVLIKDQFPAAWDVTARRALALEEIVR